MADHIDVFSNSSVSWEPRQLSQMPSPRLYEVRSFFSSTQPASAPTRGLMLDVFISNLPHELNQHTLTRELEMPCRQAGIYQYSVFLIRRQVGRRPSAILTLPTKSLADRFVSCFGSLTRFSRPLMPLLIGRQPVQCRASNRPTRDNYLVRSLAERQREMEAQQQRTLTAPAAAIKDIKSFPITGFQCGAWAPEARDNNLVFNERYTLMRSGTLHFRPRSVLIELDQEDLDTGGDGDPDFIHFMDDFNVVKHTLLVHYESVQKIETDSRDNIFFTLDHAPRIYRNKKVLSERGEYLSRERIGGIDDAHMGYSGFSMVYKVILRNASDHIKVHRLGKKAGIPPIIPQGILTLPPSLDFFTAFTRLLGELQRIPFCSAFQLNALTSNGILPPECVLQLLPRVRRLIADVGDRTAGEILKVFVVEDFDSFGNLDESSLLWTLDRRIEVTSRVLTPRWFEGHDAKYTTMAYVHRAMITPTGVFFYGPRWEASNRVLRDYREYQDYFLRVSFCEEDGEQFMHEPRVTADEILKEQFLKRVDPAQGGRIVIAGRSFEFLGFSNSSLKAQTCWFMAPFPYPGEGGMMNAKRCIKRLGDFSHIRLPGRYAARVGQAFSDTIGATRVEADHEVRIDDIERLDSNGKKRNFSDGVGKVSWQLVKRIWQCSGRIEQAKPTVFQIRYAGAKGMIALDPTLMDNKLYLRNSMVKFEGSEAREIEICSWATRLPLFLNRPLIKVLEDRGVTADTFKSLQDDALRHLRDSSKSAHLAANFLRRRGISSPALRLPWLFERLHNLEMDFRDDPFLARAMELAFLIDLRDMKYKGRIPVPDGVTLVGVMDETKFLEEGEIYISMEDEEGNPEVHEGRVIIARSPVHHPGDVQCVNSVRVPPNSPLKLLRNCVVFSQQGDRPLPSMLSGGDLDGDLYNIVFDQRFMLSADEPAAEYPTVTPLDLGRPVEATDVANFFIGFIENNLIGLISNRHLLISDQEPEGVYHPKALTCALLQSTIVDYPKTGLGVSKADIPLASRAKPDFLAPGPRVLISKDKLLHEPELENDEDEDTFVTSWYASEKILGVLYRAINEHDFLSDLRHALDSSTTTGLRRPQDLLARLWTYFQAQLDAMRVHTDYAHHAEWARGCQERYTEQLKYYMSAYSATPWNSSLSEAEVFVGTIVGRERQTRRQRELSNVMKKDYDDLVTFVVGELRGDGGDEVIDRCLACLDLALHEEGGDEIGSFAWVAVSVLMPEVDVLQKARVETRAEQVRAEKAERMERMERRRREAERTLASLTRDLERVVI